RHRASVQLAQLLPQARPRLLQALFAYQNDAPTAELASHFCQTLICDLGGTPERADNCALDVLRSASMELTTTFDANPDVARAGANGDLFVRQLLAAMLSFREGNFDVRLPSDLVGVNGKIADAFNDIVAVSERRARETARVSRAVGKEGKLKQRMSVPGV